MLRFFDNSCLSADGDPETLRTVDTALLKLYVTLELKQVEEMVKVEILSLETLSLFLVQEI